MSDLQYLESLSIATESILHRPFEWCRVEGGNVTLEDARHYGGTKGGVYQVSDLSIAKYHITAHLRSNDRGCHPPRGMLNDCGFRVLLCLGSQWQ